jgi:hypothetical protein
MIRFNTAFLLKATVIIALSCLPMALNEESGFVFTAFLLPISLASLAAAQVGMRGPFEFNFKKLPNSVVEIYATGGRYRQWLMRSRIFSAGFFLSGVVGFPMLHQVDPEPPAMWLPLVALCAVIAAVLLGCSARRTVLSDERQIVTEFLLFGRLCLWRRRWQVREGDFVAVLATGQARDDRNAEFHFCHTLFVCRSRRRQMIAFRLSASERVVPGLEIAAHVVAKLVGMPYEGYQVNKNPWSWPVSSQVSAIGPPV